MVDYRFLHRPSINDVGTKVYIIPLHSHTQLLGNKNIRDQRLTSTHLTYSLTLPF